MLKTLSTFWSFLKRPQLLKFNKDKNELKRDFLWLLLLDISIAIVIASLLWLLTEFKLIKEYDSLDMIKEFGVVGSILFVCVLAPFLEEYVFRWFLKKIYATIYFLFFTISAIFIAALGNEYVEVAVFLIFLITAMFAANYLKKLSQTKKLDLWKTYFPIIFYLSAIVFGLIHISNYDGLTIKDPTFILYVSTQIIGGLSLGYIRIKYGLKYSILFHASYNSFVLGVYLLFG